MAALGKVRFRERGDARVVSNELLCVTSKNHGDDLGMSSLRSRSQYRFAPIAVQVLDIALSPIELLRRNDPKDQP